jgi:hypothetical protein
MCEICEKRYERRAVHDDMHGEPAAQIAGLTVRDIRGQGRGSSQWVAWGHPGARCAGGRMLHETSRLVSAAVTVTVTVAVTVTVTATVAVTVANRLPSSACRPLPLDFA